MEYTVSQGESGDNFSHLQNQRELPTPPPALRSQHSCTDCQGQQKRSEAFASVCLLADCLRKKKKRALQKLETGHENTLCDKCNVPCLTYKATS